MNKRLIYRRGSITLLIATLIAVLAGCAGDSAPQMDLKNPETVRKTVVDCDSAKRAKSILEDASPGALSDNGLPDPEDRVAIASSLNAVEGQILAFCDNGPEESPSAPATSTESGVSTSSPPDPTASSSVDPTESATAMASPTKSVSPGTDESELAEPSIMPSPTLDPLKVRTWGELIEFAPESLAEKIDASTDKTGLSWDAVKQLADLRVDGKSVDARLIITANETPDVEEARIETGVEGSTVRVITMTGCIVIETGEACPTGTFLTYAPLEKSKNVLVLKPGMGIALISNTLVPVIYQTP